ncbi:hypothetical protein BDW75DRAFT_241868 [Aspergillus navahoensis]
MEYQPHLGLGSPTATQGPSHFIPEMEYPCLPLNLISGLNTYMAFRSHSHGTDTLPSSSTTSLENSPIVSPAPSVSLARRDTSEPKAARRRAQNREAQRRFRERKEQQKQVLQKDAEELRKDYQALLKQYVDTASEVTRLVKENNLLRFEVRSLRQQWRFVPAVLQRFQGVDSLGVLPEGALPFKDVQDYLGDIASGPLSNTTPYFS